MGISHLLTPTAGCAADAYGMLSAIELWRCRGYPSIYRMDAAGQKLFMGSGRFAGHLCVDLLIFLLCLLP